MMKKCAYPMILTVAAFLFAGCFGDSDDPGFIGGMIEASQQAQAQQQAQAEAMAKQMEQQMRQQMEAEMSGQPVQPVPGATAPAAPPPPGLTGVPECDDYIINYPRCVQSSAPSMAKASMMAGFEAQKAGWLEMAKTPEARMSLQMGCQIALTQGKAAMAAYGCDWK